MSNNTKIKNVIFWGATGQAKVLYEYLSHTDQKLVALFDNNKNINSPFNDVELHYGIEELNIWLNNHNKKSTFGFYVAIGGDKGKDRLAIYDQLISFGIKPMNAIHPAAFIAKSAVIGSGTQILANSAVCTDVKIGRCCIVNTSASIDHECQLGDGVHICPGVSMAGCINVGSFVTIGTGATILPNLNIGEGATIGAGAVVTKDIPKNTVVVGNPARIIKEK
jgi:sugar O-acyltransferase (sialic acid O-acetyltransferase NeuD family)